MNEWQQNTRRLTVRLGIWTGLWLLSTALATFGPIEVWDSQLLTIAGVVLNVGIGVGMMLANKEQLKSLDELQQKIQLECMGLTLGAGLVLGIAFSILDTADVISFGAEIPYLVMMMSLIYLASLFINTRRYQ